MIILNSEQGIAWVVLMRIFEMNLGAERHIQIEKIHLKKAKQTKNS